MRSRYKFLNLIMIGFLSSTLLYASIDDEIEAIQQAPIEERFKLMNELKKRIVQMKEEKRMTTIKKLQSATQGEVIEREEDNMTQEQNSTDSFNKKIESHTQGILENHRESVFEEQHHGDD